MDQSRVAKRRRRRWMSQNNRLLFPNADVWPQASDWLIRDEFTDTVAAGSVNGTAATPGPGMRAASAANVTVGSGYAESTGTNTWGAASIYISTAVTRAAGVALIQNKTFAATAPAGGMFGWRTDQSLDFAGHNNVGLSAAAGPSIAVRYTTAGGSPSIMDTSANTAYVFVNILRSAGRIVLCKISGAWKLLWVDSIDSTATMYASVMAAYTTGVAVRDDFARVIALPAPFDTDDSLATDTKSGSVADGTTFTHEPNMLLEFTQTTVPSADNTEVAFRYIDASNGWSVRIFNNGSIYLLERYQSPSSITRGGVGAGTVTNGMRIVVIADSTSVKVYGNNTLLISYASATTFLTETGGKLIALGTDGAVSDLKTWPRTLSGTAASILNKVSA